jgi:phosphatidylserine/phosphatidylglycerophosphate/cardiolipin synthase-like enzyme
MDGTLDNLNVSQDENNFLFEKEHSKGLISDTWALIGSMNFTYSGVEINGELVTFKTDPNSIGQLAAAFTDLFEAENE